MPLRDHIQQKPWPPDPPPGPAALTPREIEVAGYLGMDFTPAAIAQALGIQRETVRIHMKNIYRKLGVRSRHAAVVLLVQAGVRVTRKGGLKRVRSRMDALVTLLRNTPSTPAPKWMRAQARKILKADGSDPVGSRAWAGVRSLRCWLSPRNPCREASHA